MKVEKQLRWKQIQINFTLLLNSLILWLVLGTRYCDCFWEPETINCCWDMDFMGKKSHQEKPRFLYFVEQPVQITPKDFFRHTWIWLKVSYLFHFMFFFIFYHHLICWVRGGHVLTYLWSSEDFLYFIYIFHISSPSDLLGHVLTHLRSSEDLSERELVNETICSIALSDVSDTVLFFLPPISFSKEIIYTNGTFLAKLISFKSL